MIKQLLDSVIAKYRDLSTSRRLIICLSRIIDLLTTEKSRYFAQPRPIIANHLVFTLASISDLFSGYSGYSGFSLLSKASIFEFQFRQDRCSWRKPIMRMFCLSKSSPIFLTLSILIYLVLSILFLVKCFSYLSPQPELSFFTVHTSLGKDTN